MEDFREETREETMNWAKERALEFLDNGSTTDAFTSFTSDLQKLGLFNPAIEMAISIFMIRIVTNQVGIEETKQFIKDFS